MIRSKSILLGLGLLLTAACSKENNVDQSQTSNNSYQQNIGQEGGLVGVQGGLSIFIPAGALAEPTPISLSDRPAPGSYPVPPPEAMGNPVYSFEPHGLQFLTPVDVHLPLPSGVNIGTVWHAELNGSFAMMPPGANFEAPTVDFETSAFSFFMVGQTQIANGSDGGPPAGDGGTMLPDTTPDGGGGSGGGGPMDCTGAAPVASAPTGTTDGTGSVMHMQVPAGVPFNAVDGYAVTGTTEMPGQFSTTYGSYLTLVFTDYVGACGYAQGAGNTIMDGHFMPDGGKQGSRAVSIELNLQSMVGPIPIQTMTYAQGNPDGMAMGRFFGLDATCGMEQATLPMVTLTITSITATTVEGHIDAMGGPAMDTFAGDFSFPICELGTVKGMTCCLP